VKKEFNERGKSLAENPDARDEDIISHAASKAKTWTASDQA